MFLNQPLIISDLLYVEDHQWVSSEQYVSALLYFEKITTGNALDASWNIAEDHKVQDTLADLITDYLNRKNKNPDIPEYIRLLFKHFCTMHTTPLFDGIEQLKDEMSSKLKKHLFDENMTILNRADGIEKAVMSYYNLMNLFPEAGMGETIGLEPGIMFGAQETPL